MKSSSNGTDELFEASDDDFADVMHVADLAHSRPQHRRRCPRATKSSRADCKDDESRGPMDLFERSGRPIEPDEHVGEKEHEQEDDEEKESVGVMIAMSLLVVCLLAFVGYISYQVVVSEDQFANRMPARPQVEAKHVQIQVDLAQLYSGHQLQVGVARKLVCEHCAGRGVDLKGGFHACHKCDGTGVQTFIQQIGPIKQHIRSVCKACKGWGQVAKNKCDVCHGAGYHHETKMVTVEIEKGMRHGDQIVLAHQGDQSPQAIPGDVVVHLYSTNFAGMDSCGLDPLRGAENEAPPSIHASRQRSRASARDLAARGTTHSFMLVRPGEHDRVTNILNDSYPQALVGFTREIEHLDRRIVRLARDQVVSPDMVWKIPNEGMPIRQNEATKGGRAAGNLLVHFSIQYPSEYEELNASLKQGANSETSYTGSGLC